MRQVAFEPTFAGWQAEARVLLALGVPPPEILWTDRRSAQGVLELSPAADAARSSGEYRVPKTFLTMAHNVCCHRDPGRWPLLYRLLWRLTHGERHLMEVVVDEDVHRLAAMDKEVRRDVHKMRAFVRFRRVEREGAEWYVAWFEPEHHIVERNAPFFIDRFAEMRWSILTPDRCAHWDGAEICFTDGLTREAAPTEDTLEDLWRTYYGSIFNPARIKTHAMAAEMPKKYWKNLPEARVIPSLLSEAPARIEQMLKASAMKTMIRSVASPPETRSLAALEKAARDCTACPLFKNATQTVFGRGSRKAQLVFVGEQPGDQEDRAGEPFVGPAGKLLDRALAEAGIDRSLCYVTNAVKHFKWEPRGKHRIHKKPAASEIAACHPWLEAELELIGPKVLVCLGGTAAQAVVGPGARVLRDRGKQLSTPYCSHTMITIHPSALLRAPDEAARREGFELLVKELRLAAEWLRE